MPEIEPQIHVILAAAYAMVLGGAIGFERELKNRPAGFRTHMLVAGAASLLIGMGVMLAQGDPRFRNDVHIDPLRLVEATIAGVAFIGAGTIFSRRRGQDIAGITTAASLLMVAVIGIATGLGYHLLAAMAAVMTLLVLLALDAFERWQTNRKSDAAEAASKRSPED